MIVATSNPFAVLDGMSLPRRLVCPAYSYPTRQPPLLLPPRLQPLNCLFLSQINQNPHAAAITIPAVALDPPQKSFNKPNQMTL